MANQLVKLKETKEKINKSIKKLENERDLLITNYTSKVQDILDNMSIVCSVNANNNRLNLRFNNRESVFDRVVSIEKVRNTENDVQLSVLWSSGSFNESSRFMINYINALHFITNSIEKNENNELINSIKSFFIDLTKKDKKITDTWTEFHSVSSELNRLQLEIKRTNFFKNLKDGNFYFNYYKPRFSTGYYRIFYVEKVNNVTSNVYRFKSSNVDGIKHTINYMLDIYKRRRIRNEDLFHEIGNYTMFRKENLEKVLTEHQIKVKMEKIYEEYDSNFMKDMKKLCNTLFKFNVINKPVPSNDILSIISEKRHHLLKYGITE